MSSVVGSATYACLDARVDVSSGNGPLIRRGAALLHGAPPLIASQTCASILPCMSLISHTLLISTTRIPPSHPLRPSTMTPCLPAAPLLHQPPHPERVRHHPSGRGPLVGGEAQQGQHPSRCSGAGWQQVKRSPTPQLPACLPAQGGEAYFLQHDLEHVQCSVC
jgi:hypothetical protein